MTAFYNTYIKRVVPFHTQDVPVLVSSFTKFLEFSINMLTYSQFNGQKIPPAKVDRSQSIQEGKNTWRDCLYSTKPPSLVYCLMVSAGSFPSERRNCFSSALRTGKEKRGKNHTIPFAKTFPFDFHLNKRCIKASLPGTTLPRGPPHSFQADDDGKI